MSEYAKRAVMGIMAHYAKHVQAMTAEGLHEKSDIAAELAWRDAQLESCNTQLAELRDVATDLLGQINNVDGTAQLSTDDLGSALRKVRWPVALHEI